MEGEHVTLKRKTEMPKYRMLLQLGEKLEKISRQFKLPSSTFNSHLEYVLNDTDAFSRLNDYDLGIIKKIRDKRVQIIILSSEKFLNTLSAEELVDYSKSNIVDIRIQCAESRVFARKVPIDVLLAFTKDNQFVASSLTNNEEAIDRLAPEDVEEIAKSNEAFVRRALISNKKTPEKLSKNTLIGFLTDNEPLVRIAAARNPEVLKRLDKKTLKEVLKNESDQRVCDSLRMYFELYNSMRTTQHLLYN